MGSTDPLHIVLSVLLTIFWAGVMAEAQSFSRVPNDGDCCRTYRYVYQGADSGFMAALLQQIGVLPCAQGKVVNSHGDCVDPWSPLADRCQDTENFNQTKVDVNCRLNPAAIFADPFDCNRYYNCSSDITDKHVSCPYDWMTQSFLSYDDITKSCRPAIDVRCGQRPVHYSQAQLKAMCRTDPSRVITDSSSCNAYYDCAQEASARSWWWSMSDDGDYIAECPYLQLFDSDTKRCTDFTSVSCVLRGLSKNPCSWRQKQCWTAHCKPCELEYPDCTQLDNGDQPFPNQLYTPRYVHCYQGWTVNVSTCDTAVPNGRHVEPRLFDARTKRCRPISAIPRSLGGLGSEDDG